MTHRKNSVEKENKRPEEKKFYIQTYCNDTKRVISSQFMIWKWYIFFILKSIESQDILANMSTSHEGNSFYGDLEIIVKFLHGGPTWLKIVGSQVVNQKDDKNLKPHNKKEN